LPRSGIDVDIGSRHWIAQDFMVHARPPLLRVTAMSEPPVYENEPPSRALSDFVSPERFAEFNAETRRLRRELAREEEAALRDLTFLPTSR
jgi:hypothetical protein